MTKKILLIAALSYLPFVGGMQGASLFAQRIHSSSKALAPAVKGATTVSFIPDGKLSEYITPAQPVEWGMDVAWNWDVNVLRGTNAITKNVLKVGRVSFQPAIMKDDYTLSDWQITNLNSRLANIALSGVKDIVLNCDHEVLMNKESYPDCDKNYAEYNGKPENWVKVIKATAIYCQGKGFNVYAVSPFNEPDYKDWKEGSQADFKEICRLIREDYFFDNIRICAGNTLNCDQALSWYNYMKPYVNEGNTHQLAGSMANYIKFWQTVRADGNHATADELHNTMEAFIGIHHGMQTGIWWGWDGIARGEFCQASYYGKEIGYAENASNWTGAAVYKWNRPATVPDASTATVPDASPSGEERINAFAGASERQAKPTTFDFVSTDRPVYYDGYGPVYSYSQYIPADANGTYNSAGQKNAERIIGITYGEDIPMDYPREGTFIIMNANSKCALSSASSPVQQKKYASTIGPTDAYFWTVEPVKETIGGDFSYCTIKKYNSTDGKNLTTNSEWGTSEGISVKYSTNWANSGRNEWFFEYAGDNFWYIRNRWTGFYLQPQNASTVASAVIVMNAFTGKPEQKWRIFPAIVPQTTANKKLNGMLEFDAPVVPSGLKAKVNTASVLLSWNPNTDADLAGYNVIRAKASAPQDIDVIGRMVTDTTFLDNDITPGVNYIYKVKAVDKTRNISLASDGITATVPEASASGKSNRALIAHYSFDTNLRDTTENQLDAVISGTATFKNPVIGGAKEGTSTLYLDGSTNLLSMPASLGSMSEMTISMWVYNSSYSTSWTRLFDFGNDTDHYFFLTPYNGSQMRLVMKNGGDEQILSTTRLTTGWHYIAVTLAKDKVTLYVDAKTPVVSTTMTIRPSDFMPKRNFIGASQFPADPLFKGNIDDLRIYNYPLSAAEISRLRDLKELPTGDANKDGKVTVADANIVINYAVNKVEEGVDLDAADMDLDGNVTEADAKAITEKYLTE